MLSQPGPGNLSCPGMLDKHIRYELCFFYIRARVFLGGLRNRTGMCIRRGLQKSFERCRSKVGRDGLWHTRHVTGSVVYKCITLGAAKYGEVSVQTLETQVVTHITRSECCHCGLPLGPAKLDHHQTQENAAGIRECFLGCPTGLPGKRVGDFVQVVYAVKQVIDKEGR